jgi:hypothetical protein
LNTSANECRNPCSSNSSFDSTFFPYQPSREREQGGQYCNDPECGVPEDKSWIFPGEESFGYVARQAKVVCLAICDASLMLLIYGIHIWNDLKG